MARWSAWPGISGNKGEPSRLSSRLPPNGAFEENPMAKYKRDIFGIGTLFAISMAGLLAFEL